MVTLKPVSAAERGIAESRFNLEILPLLAPPIAELLKNTPVWLSGLEEIRLRSDRPLILRSGHREVTLTYQGEANSDLSKGYVVTAEQVRTSLEIMTRSSIYAWEEELRNGFLTLKGGHRVGLSGKVVLEDGKVKTLRHISSLNIRISREVKGVGKRLLPYLMENSHLQSTLIISPPQAGKTTLLRDIIRLVSIGVPEAGLRGMTVGVVDERSEIAGCWEGIPQNDLGPRSDVLDCCPKAQGMIMLLRSMAPQVIATDELGRAEDIHALEEAVNGGVTVITTVHGLNESEVRRKPLLGNLLDTGVFQRIVILSRRLGVGTVEKVWDVQQNQDILHGPLVLAGR